MSPLLSICIPTYNRSRFLDEAIASIASQVTPDLADVVELCISDNASTDDTDDVIDKWRKSLPIPITYAKSERNCGADANYVKVVDISHGKYCWYLGSDDMLRSGGLKSVINQLMINPHLCGMIVRSEGVSFDGSQEVPLPKFIEACDKEFNDVDELLSEVGQYIALISSLIFRRDVWEERRNELRSEGKTFIYFAFEHVITIVRMMKTNPRWFLFSKDPVVCWRASNDSFAEEGVLRRYLIDVEGHSRIFLDEFGRFSKIFRRTSTRAIRHWHRGRLHQAKRSNLTIATYIKALISGLKMYWNIPSFYFVILLSFIPKKLYVLLDEVVISWKQKAAMR